MSDEEFKDWPLTEGLPEPFQPYNFEAEVAKIVKEEVAPAPKGFPEYKGLSYRAASKEADSLIRRFGWFQSFDRLSALKGVMAKHLLTNTAK